MVPICCEWAYYLFSLTDLSDGLGSLQAHLGLNLAPEPALHIGAGGGGQKLYLLDPEHNTK